nr:IS5 family transposase [Cellulomonas flavigena]
MTRAQELSDAQWERIAPLMPLVRGRSRPFRDHRQVVEGIVHRYRCGIAWRDLPERFGPWQTVWKRHARFSRDGTWDRILTAVLADADAAGDIDWAVSIDSTINRAHQHATTLPRVTGGTDNHRNLRVEPGDHAIGRSRGGLSTKIHHAVDGKGRPLAVLLGPGQGGDAPMCLPVLNTIRVPRKGSGRPRTRPDAVLADKAYSSRAIRAELRRRGVVSVIPEPRNQQGHRKRRGSAGGRPVTYDPDQYKRRNVVERAFNALKHWRGLATRYDKHAVTYRGAVVLAAILAWLRAPTCR